MKKLRSAIHSATLRLAFKAIQIGSNPLLTGRTKDEQLEDLSMGQEN